MYVTVMLLMEWGGACGGNMYVSPVAFRLNLRINNVAMLFTVTVRYVAMRLF